MSSGKDCLELYLEEIGDITPLTSEEEYALAKRIQKGDEKARAEMIRSNLRLVVSIARKYCNMGLSFLDLIEEGNIGLIKASEKYNLKHDCRFATYAAWWIKQRIMRGLSNQAKMIRIPAYMIDRMLLVRRVKNKLKNGFTENPDVELIAKETHLEPEQVKEALECGQYITSLSMPVGEDGDTELLDLIEDPLAQPPSSRVATSMIREEIIDLLDVLNEREVKLIINRFGLFNNPMMTLEQIGDKMNITRERVRQLEKAAIEKMKKALIKKKHHFHDF
ncbi:MAG: RNA polymerase sigma factor RpoD/SigA [Candidatus Aureabacteria bacterium]|nr:RNA polymerase sigma factor RpoD/SigA [Candidatus Auribacterota bacterium]